LSDVSDIEKLLAAHKRHIALVSWLKTGLVAVSTAVAAFFGAGWTARGYLEQLSTKEQVTALMNGQKTQISDLEDKSAKLAERVSLTEEHDRAQDESVRLIRSDVKEVQGRAGVLVRR
jgi:hypothetical protein